MSERIFKLHGEIDGNTAAAVMWFCRQNDGVPVLVDIDSTGGCFESALAIHYSLKKHGQAIGHVSGECSSGTNLVLAGCKLRTCANDAFFMFHRGRNLRHPDWDFDAIVADQQEAIIVGKAIGRPDSVVMGWIRAHGKPDRETWFTAGQAQREGLVHRVENECGELLDSAGRLLYLKSHLKSVDQLGNRQAQKRAAMAAVQSAMKLPPISSMEMSARHMHIINTIRRHGGNPFNIVAWG